jgi:hypothetical protein
MSSGDERAGGAMEPEPFHFDEEALAMLTEVGISEVRSLAADAPLARGPCHACPAVDSARVCLLSARFAC